MFYFYVILLSTFSATLEALIHDWKSVVDRDVAAHFCFSPFPVLDKFLKRFLN